MAKSASSGNPRCVRLGDEPAPHGAVVLVPGTEVPVMRFDIPAGVRGYARKQIAYRQMRDRMGLQAHEADLRPLILNGQRDGWQTAMLVGRETLSGWVSRAGRKSGAIIPDYMSLPVTDGVWTLAFGTTHIVARLGLADGFSAEPELALLQLMQQVQKVRPKAIYVIGDPDEVSREALDKFDVPLITKPDQATKHGAEPPRAFARGELELDLRNDPDAERRALRRTVTAWMWPVAIGAAALACWAVVTMMDLRKTEARLDDLRTATISATRESFVPEGPILDVRTQIARALEQMHAQLDAQRDTRLPLDLFYRAADPLHASGATVTSISYEASAGLIADVQVERFAELDALRAALQATGLRVDITESSSDAQGVFGRLALEGAP